MIGPDAIIGVPPPRRKPPHREIPPAMAESNLSPPVPDALFVESGPASKRLARETVFAKAANATTATLYWT
jgi:hypothetical protein